MEDNPAEPFSYYRSPYTVVGVYGGPEEAVVTPPGYLQNAFGTLEMSSGVQPTAVDQRVKTWRDGWLPVLQASFDRDGVHNDINYLATKVHGVATVPYTEWYGNPRQTLTDDVENMVSFIKVKLTNTTEHAVTYRFGTDLTKATVIKPNQNMPTASNPGPSRPKEPGWDPTARAVVGDGKLLYTASRQPTTSDGETLTFTFDLAPHASDALVLGIPYWVGPASDAAAIHGTSFDDELARTVSFWKDKLDSATTSLDVPGAGDEDKVLDTYRTSIVLSLIDMDVVGGEYFWDANPTKYDNYWLRDAAFDIDGMLKAGFPQVARANAEHMLSYQKADGQFESQPRQWDANGQTLWTFGNYVARTNDSDFAKQVLPAVKRAMDWEWTLRKGAWDEAGGLFPSGVMTDNDSVRGHIVGYDLAAIMGERGAVQVARAAGEQELADQWSQRADEYTKILRDKLAPTVKDVGWIPPTVEGMKAPATKPGWYGNQYGIDWGNLEATWPSGVFEPSDTWVQESLKAWSSKYREGLFTYPSGGFEGRVHSYTPMSITETFLRAGDAPAALRDMYNLLVHTSSTHTAAEVIDAADRDMTAFQTDPHGEFAGKYIALLRDMLATEQDGRLQLAGALSPVWTRAGRHVAFRGDTDFGPLSYRIDFGDQSATAQLSVPSGANAVTLGVPVGVRVTQVTVGGAHQAPPAVGRPIDLGHVSGKHTVRFTWTGLAGASLDKVADATTLSYPRAVSDYQANYQAMQQPVKLTLGQTKVVDSGPVYTGETVRVRTGLHNSGGAGRIPTDAQPVVYVDGKKTDYAFPAVSRGIGFNTPAEVTSFSKIREGEVALDFPARFCATGEHTVALGLGGSDPGQAVTIDVQQPPSGAAAPAADLKVGDELISSYGGDTAKVDVTFSNPSCETLTGVKVDVQTPEGWSPVSPVDLGDVQPGSTVSSSVSVSVPRDPSPDAALERVQLPLRASYGWSGGSTIGQATADASLGVLAGVHPPFESNAAGTEAWFGVTPSQLAIVAGGRDIWKGRDEFGALYQPDVVQGSTTVTTRVVEQGDSWPWAKAGLMLRSDTSQSRSPGYVILAVTPENGYALQWDSDGDGLLDSQEVVGATSYPSYLRLVRDAGHVTAKYSPDGTDWQHIATVSVPGLTDGADAGVFASAVNVHVPGTLSAVVFDHFDVSH